MPADDEAITAALLAEPELAELLAAGDVYLVGSRAHGRAAAAGEWDLLVLLADDREIPEKLTTPLAGDTAASAPDLRAAEERRQRLAGGLSGVAVEFCGPTARRRREARDLPMWQFELAESRLLYAGWGGGDAYRQQIAERFRAACELLARRAYVRFRADRGDAAGALLHGDQLAVTITTSLAARAALRCWLLWQGRPYPSDPWLPSFFAEDPRGDDLLAAARTAVRDQASGEDRYAALQRLWWLLDRHVRAHGAEVELLAAWWTFHELLGPFVPEQPAGRASDDAPLVS